VRVDVQLAKAWMAYFVFVIMRFIGKAQNPKLADFAISPTN
jgi:hypothetical protein